jgi:cobalt-zinc-cadmium efflux system outer membrane protein
LRVFPWKGCVLLLLLTGFVRAQDPALTFEQVTELALQAHPIELAQRASVRATEALIQQAGVRPNPTLQLQTQTDGFERASQLGLSISQRLELGGKKAARIKAAEADHTANQIQTEVRMALFRYELSESFLNLLLAQEGEGLALQSLAMTERHLEIAQTRFEVGDLSGAELATLKVERDRKLAQVELSKGATARARADLGKFVPSSVLKAGVRGRLGFASGLPSVDILKSEGPLALRLARANLNSKETQVYLERSLGVSDITLQAGAFVQRTVFPGSSYVPSGVVGGLDDTGPLLQFQIQIPLPINDDNSGSIAAAQARQEQAKAELEALEMEVSANLEGLYFTLQGQREARLLMEKQAEPAAFKSLQSVEEAYKLGFRSQLDLLLAKQTYLETREAILEAAFDESLTAAQLERVLGHPLKEMQNEDFEAL